MMIFGIICLLAVIVLCFFNCNDATISFSAFLLVLVSAAFIIAGHSRIPSAIDVYRGKTTLEITWKDSVAIDTTVVWK